jgi:glycosyltransferase involved in cell wall biosynthesis
MESPSSPFLSIVIRTVSHRYPIVKKVLEHIDKTDLGLSIADFEVVVSEDGPPYALSEAMLNEGLSRIKVAYTPNTRTRGMSANRNAGALAARGEYLVLIDDDVLLPPNVLQATLNTLIDLGKDAILTVPFERVTRIDIDSSSSPPYWINLLMPARIPVEGTLSPVPSNPSIRPSNIAQGCFIGIAKSTYMQIGGFLEIVHDRHVSLHFASDDIYFGYKAQELGHPIYALEITVGHLDDHVYTTEGFIKRLEAMSFGDMLLNRLYPEKGPISNIAVFYPSNPFLRAWRVGRGEICAFLLPILSFLAKRKAISTFLTRLLAHALWIGAVYKGIKEAKRAKFEYVFIHQPPLREVAHA